MSTDGAPEAAKLAKVVWHLVDYDVDGRHGEFFWLDVGSADQARKLLARVPPEQHLLDTDYYDAYGDIYGSGLHLFYLVARDLSFVKRESCMFVHMERKLSTKAAKIFAVQERAFISSLDELPTFVVQKAREQRMVEDAGEDVELKEYNARILEELREGELTKEQLSAAAAAYKDKAQVKAKVAAEKTKTALFNIKAKIDERRGHNLEPQAQRASPTPSPSGSRIGDAPRGSLDQPRPSLDGTRGDTAPYSAADVYGPTAASPSPAVAPASPALQRDSLRTYSDKPLPAPPGKRAATPLPIPPSQQHAHTATSLSPSLSSSPSMSASLADEPPPYSPYDVAPTYSVATPRGGGGGGGAVSASSSSTNIHNNVTATTAATPMPSSPSASPRTHLAPSGSSSPFVGARKPLGGGSASASSSYSSLPSVSSSATTTNTTTAPSSPSVSSLRATTSNTSVSASFSPSSSSSSLSTNNNNNNNNYPTATATISAPAAASPSPAVRSVAQTKTGLLGKFSSGIANKATQKAKFGRVQQNPRSSGGGSASITKKNGVVDNFARRSVTVEKGHLNYGELDDKTGSVKAKGAILLRDARVCAYKHNGVAGYLRVWPTNGPKLKEWILVPWDGSANLPRPDPSECDVWLKVLESQGAIVSSEAPPPPSGRCQLMVQKLGGSKMMPKWQERWIVVTNTTDLVYYSVGSSLPNNSATYTEKGRIGLRQLPVNNVDQSFKGTFSKAAYCIRLALPEKEMFLNCNSKADRETLRKALVDAGAHVK